MIVIRGVWSNVSILENSFLGLPARVCARLICVIINFS